MASSTVETGQNVATTSTRRPAGWVRRSADFISGMPTVPLVCITALVCVAVFAPFISPHSPTESNILDRLMPPAWMDGGSAKYLLGTDKFGRDILSRIIFGARVSLEVSILAIVLSGSIGTAVGVVAGYYGGWVDSVLMRLTDIGLSMPLMLVAILFAVLSGPSFRNVIIIIGLLLWPRYARQIRGETLSIKEQDFIDSARVIGCSNARIMWSDILPNLMPTLLVLASLQVGYVILLEASLSFLGVGVPEPQPSWGSIVSGGQQYIDTKWWISVFPGIAILLTVLSINNLGDWIRDRLDPKLRQV